MNEEDYLRMILKKTCWYTCIHPCRIGALVGLGESLNLNRFNLFAYYMAAAFQIQDDILNLVGDHEKYGKEIDEDTWEGKRTMVLIHLLNHCSVNEKERIQFFLSKPCKNCLSKDVKWIYQLMTEYNSTEFVCSKARQLAGVALKEFFVAYDDRPNTDDKQFISENYVYFS